MGFIKKLIAGIISFITGLLPGKKKGGYYLELDESASESTSTASTNATVAQTVTTTPPQAAPAPVKAKKSDTGKVTKAEPAPAAASTKTLTTFAPQYLSPIASNSNGRRRPGANMSAYLELASQVKISS